MVRVGPPCRLWKQLASNNYVVINTAVGFADNGNNGMIYYRAPKAKLLASGNRSFGKQGHAGCASYALFEIIDDTEFLIRNSGETDFRIISVKKGSNHFNSTSADDLERGRAVKDGLLNPIYAKNRWRDLITWTKVR